MDYGQLPATGPFVITPSSAYLIFSTQRSGSTYLCELLASTGVAGNPQEYFEARAETGLPPHPGYFLAGLPRTGAGIRDDLRPTDGPDYSDLRTVDGWQRRVRRQADVEPGARHRGTCCRAAGVRGTHRVRAAGGSVRAPELRVDAPARQGSPGDQPVARAPDPHVAPGAPALGCRPPGPALQLRRNRAPATPAERRRRRQNPDYASVLAELRERLHRWMVDTDDPLLRGPINPPPGAAINSQSQRSADDPTITIEAGAGAPM